MLTGLARQRSHAWKPPCIFCFRHVALSGASTINFFRESPQEFISSMKLEMYASKFVFIIFFWNTSGLEMMHGYTSLHPWNWTDKISKERLVDFVSATPSIDMDRFLWSSSREWRRQVLLCSAKRSQAWKYEVETDMYFNVLLLQYDV